MKRIILIVALALSTVLANAQKTAQDCQKDVASKKAVCDNPKKNIKPAPWIAYAKSLVKAHEAPKGDAMLGTAKSNFALLMGGVNPKSAELVKLDGSEYEVQHYANCDYYFAPNGQLTCMVPTVVFVENALEEAVKAYAKAAEVDPSGSKTKDICEGLKNIANLLRDEAGVAYTLGQMETSSLKFEQAADAALTKPNSVIDTMSYFNAGITAVITENFERAKTMFEKCLEYGYTAKGDTYFRLADCHDKLGDKTGCKTLLEQGFELYPDNQAIIVSLINLYIDTKDDPNKLFALLDKAKANDPKNASLYYVEGNIYKQIGNIEAAEASYDKCSEVNPEYEYGYIGKALLYCEQADKVREIADKEYDDRKYMALVEQFEGFCLKALPPFEKAFEISKDPQTKTSIAEYLKNLYYRFRDKDASYQAAYDKYSNIVKNGL